MAEPTLGALLAEARLRLRDASVGEPESDLRVLAAHAFALDAAGLMLRAHEPAPKDAQARFQAAVERRLAGVPVHRITGRRAFYAHEFALSSETLEPRPDTETLVDLSVAAFRERGHDEIVFADVGTGSGAIGISLLALFPAAICVAVDLSPGALDTAWGNARAAGVEDRFRPVVSDYLSAVEGPLDAVVSNPPYVPSGDIAGLQREVREHDPHLALDGGPDGLDAYRRIVAQAKTRLRAGGDLLLEMGAGQEGDVAAIATGADFEPAGSARDLAGHIRALRFRRAD